MSKWTIRSKKPTGGKCRQESVWIFDNGFYIESCELERFTQNEERGTFIDSIKENKLSKALLGSINYPGDDVDFYFEYKQNEMGTTLAWRNYESETIELKEYDSNWANLYQEEYKEIVVRIQKSDFIRGSTICPISLFCFRETFLNAGMRMAPKINHYY